MYFLFSMKQTFKVDIISKPLLKFVGLWVRDPHTICVIFKFINQGNCLKKNMFGFAT